MKQQTFETKNHSWLAGRYVIITNNLYINIRAVKVNALIYEIIVAEINAIKYFNAVNATLFTSGVRCPLTRNRRVPT